MTVYPSFSPTALFTGDRQHIQRVISLGGNQASVRYPRSQVLERGTVLGRSVIGGVETYVISKTTAVDGSQIPVAVLATDVDTSIGVTNAPAYFEGEYAAESAFFDPSWTITTLEAVTRLNDIPLFFRSVGAVA